MKRNCRTARFEIAPIEVTIVFRMFWRAFQDFASLKMRRSRKDLKTVVKPFEPSVVNVTARSIKLIKTMIESKM